MAAKNLLESLEEVETNWLVDLRTSAIILAKHANVPRGNHCLVALFKYLAVDSPAPRLGDARRYFAISAEVLLVEKGFFKNINTMQTESGFGRGNANLNWISGGFKMRALTLVGCGVTSRP